MFCGYCGKEGQDDQKFCPYCGYVIANEESENVSDEVSPDETEQTVTNKSEANPSYLVKALVAVLVVFLCVVVGLFVKDFLYKQSDEYKIEKATQAIFAGDYYNAVREIEDIDTDTANAIREYIIVLGKRDELIKSHSSSKLATDSVAFDNYLSALKNFDNYYFLPETLLCLYKNDIASAETILENIESWYTHCIEAQKIFLYASGAVNQSTFSSIIASANIKLFNMTFSFPSNEYTKLLLECKDELFVTLEDALTYVESGMEDEGIYLFFQYITFDCGLPAMDVFTEEYEAIEKTAQLLKYTYMRDVMICEAMNNLEDAIYTNNLK